MLYTSEIIDKYCNGASISSLSREYQITTYKIKKILQENNINIRSRNEQNKYSPQNQRKYKIDDNYFDVIDKEDKAYLLGFLAADGAVQKRGNIKITLSRIDRNFLEQIREILNTNYPIHDYLTKDGYETSELSFRSSQIMNELSKYGIVNKKTYSFSFPYNIPEEYYIDFIRGYWDGDGTICKSGNYARASLCSHQKNFLEEVLRILEKFGIPKVTIHKDKRNEVYYIQYASQSSEKLYHLFYKNKNNFNIYLTRKYEKFVKLFGEINSHEPATSQEEEKIV